MNTTGVHLSHDHDVKSHRDPIKSVYLLGVVPCVSIFHFRLASFCLISFLIAVFNSSHLRLANLLSDKYLSFNSLGLPSSPTV